MHPLGQPNTFFAISWALDNVGVRCDQIQAGGGCGQLEALGADACRCAAACGLGAALSCSGGLSSDGALPALPGDLSQPTVASGYSDANSTGTVSLEQFSAV